MRTNSPAKVYRAEQVHFRYWHSPAYRYQIESERPPELPARERCVARVTVQSYIAGKLNLACVARRSAPFALRPSDCIDAAWQLVESARRMRTGTEVTR